MTQFAVYPSPAKGEDVAFVSQIQSSRLERNKARVVMALSHAYASGPRDHALTPHMIVFGKKDFADPKDIATIPVLRLGGAIGILSEPDQDNVTLAVIRMIRRA